MKRPEQDLQIRLCKILAAALPHDAIFFAIPNAGRRGIVEANMMKRTGLRAGMPDLCCIDGGKAYFLELKSEDGRLSSNQREMCNLLKIAGAKVAVVRSVDEALDALRGFGVALRIAPDIRLDAKNNGGRMTAAEFRGMK